MRHLDLDTWPRKQHFEFFKSYERPFFNLCADVDVTELRAMSKTPGGPSFFAASLYSSLAAANAVEEFRYRIRGERVVIHDRVHAGTTVLRPDDTFGFGYFDFVDDFSAFASRVAEVLATAEATRELAPAGGRDDLIYYSVIPWVRFTSFAHARTADTESVPRIVFGGYRQHEGRWWMPVSVEVHHALMDALHVGRFYEQMQTSLLEIG